jgi:hypothetical protein
VAASFPLLPKSSSSSSSTPFSSGGGGGGGSGGARAVCNVRVRVIATTTGYVGGAVGTVGVGTTHSGVGIESSFSAAAAATALS